MYFIKKILTLFLLISGISVWAQIGVPQNGVVDNFEGITAFIKCTLIKDPQTKIINATLIIQNGKITAVGSNITIPKGAKIIDLNGKWIYSSFIDLWSEYGVSKVQHKQNERGPQFLSSKRGAWYWNEAIHPELRASEGFAVQKEEAKSMRDLGFGIALSHQQNGIARGTGLIVALGDDSEQKMILNSSFGNYFSFNKGTSNQDYPSSLMGSIALLRQFYYDAKWAMLAKSNEINLSLKEYNINNSMPHFFESGDVQDLFRADKIGDEFGIQYTIKGSGDEYQFIDEVKRSNAHIMLPLNFPEAFDVEDPLDARLISLTELKHWEMAPFNPVILYNKGIEFSMTLGGMKKRDKFWSNLYKSIGNGLPEEYALKALTTNPAKVLKMESLCGTLDVGKFANFIITDGNVFKEGSSILENWVLGKQNINVDWQSANYSGKYKLAFGDSSYTININGKPWQPKAELQPKTKGEIKLSLKNGFISYQLTLKNGKYSTGTGYKSANNITLISTDSLGNPITLLAIYAGPEDGIKDSVKKKNEVLIPRYSMPWQYNMPSNQSYLIANATVWTCGNDGKLENTDVLIKDGKISAVGKSLVNSGGVKIDGTGMHLTPGIIDEHSHIAISKGVNEGTQSITSEVRIEDVVNAKDVNIYRQVAGGVTTSHLLHGSANAIGGQTALIKLKYGEASEKLKFPNDHRFIKFALGENVKQSNWGDYNTVRFPQTRMGVEQVFQDGFTRAKAYGELKKTPGYRTDLELEALLEILNAKRFITCHSYVQSEINMLLHLADSLGFKVNTFTHILEGYKVADKMKKHGVAASTFSDWWGYKYEVVDAIPYNPGIMQKVGILTGINSDDAEMGRRLNQEAAKAIMYSGVAEIDALNMVTINPAKMLHIDNKVGRISIGMDADLVLWDGQPLSNYSKPQTTWIDGKIYFDRQEDLKKRLDISKERQRIIDDMIKAKKKGEATRKAGKTIEPEYHCED